MNRSGPNVAIKLLLLFGLLLAIPARAADLTLSAPGAVEVEAPFTVTVENVPEGGDVRWQWDSDRITQTDRQKTSANFKALKTGPAEITASYDTWTKTAVITINPAQIGGRTQIQTAAWKNSKIESLLKSFGNNEISPADVFIAMGDNGFSVKDLITFKAEKINEMAKQGSYDQALQSWDANYGQTERSLMRSRRDAILQIWKQVAETYLKNNPDSPPLFRMDVGGWVSEGEPKMRFEGDIDFAIIMFNSEDAMKVRNLFEGEIKRQFHLDMIAIDALATAHRAATLSVYIGSYGADWAEKDAINRGEVFVVELLSGQLVESTAGKTEKAVAFTVLKNNEAMKKGEPNRFADIKKEKSQDVIQPTYDMEPGISLEFLRHITEDAIHSSLAIHEKIIKISKYLDRSANEHKSIMKAAGAEAQMSDPGCLDLAKKVIDLKQNKSLGPEETYLKIMKQMEAEYGADWIDSFEEHLVDFGKRAQQVMVSNIEKANQTRLDRISKEKDSGKQNDEQRKFLDELATERDAFKAQGIEFPASADEIIGHLEASLGVKGSGLPTEEESKLREYIEKLCENPHSARLVVAAIWERMSKLTAKADVAANKVMDKFNHFLDTLDQATIDKLRSGGVLQLELRGEKYVLKGPIQIAAFNQMLNNSVLGSISNSTAFKAFNLYQELDAYYMALTTAETFSDGVSNLSTELFRRHVPGGGAIDAAIQGNYLRMCFEVTYIIFPTLAIPEGVYGMVQWLGEKGAAKYNQWKYDEMVEALYRGAVFEQAGNGKDWRIQSITYDCPVGGSIIVESDRIRTLPEQCSSLSVIFYPQVRQHPVMGQLEEMLEKPAVSSGKLPTTVWPYSYSGLSLYGERLYDLYKKQVDKVTGDYFQGVVDALQKRKAWDTGTGYAEIIKIEKELNCEAPLVKYSVGYLGGDDSKADAERFQKIVDNYKRLKKANGEVLAMAKEWEANLLDGLTPKCTPASIETTSQKAENLSEGCKKGIEQAKNDVEKIVGTNASREDVLPAAQSKLCMAYHDKSSADYRQCGTEYADYLRKLGFDKPTDLKVTLDVPKGSCEGQKLTARIVYSKPCDDCSLSEWEVIDGIGALDEKQISRSRDSISWKVRAPGPNFLRLKVAQQITGADSAQYSLEGSTSAKPISECGALIIAFAAPVGSTKIQEDETLAISVKPVSLGPGKAPVKRFVWRENGAPGKPAATDDPNYIFTGFGKGGQLITVAVTAIDAEGNKSEEIKLGITVTGASTEGLRVEIKPSSGPSPQGGVVAIKQNETINLLGIVGTKSDSGILQSQWSASSDGKTVVLSQDSKGIRFSGAEWPGSDVTVSLLVVDARRREGTASIRVKVKTTESLDVSLKDFPKAVAESDMVRFEVLTPQKSDNYRYTWHRQGVKVLDNSSFHYFESDFPGQTGKIVKVKVEITDDRGRKGSAEATLSVTESGQQNDVLKVTITPASLSIKEDESRDLSCSVDPYPDSGDITYRWGDGTEATKCNRIISGKDYAGKADNNVSITVVAQDAKGRSGEATAMVTVLKKDEKTLPKNAQPTTANPEKKVASVGDPPTQDVADAAKAQDWKRLVDLRGQYVAKRNTERNFQNTINIQAIDDALPKIIMSDWQNAYYKANQEAYKKLEKAYMAEYTEAECNKCLSASNTTCPKICNDADECLRESKKQLLLVERRASLIGSSIPFEGDVVKRVQDTAKLAEKWSFPFPYPSPGAPPIMYSSECVGGSFSPKPQTTKPDQKGSGKLLLEVLTDRTNLKPGEMAQVSANVQGGVPPYTYAWSGEHAGSGAKVSFVSRTQGWQKLSVAVTDAAGNSGSGSVSLQVQDVQAVIKGLKNRISYGASLTLTGECSDCAQPGGSNQTSYNFIWQSTPTLTFNPPEGNKTTVVFDRTDSVKIWAQVQVRKGTGSVTYESPQSEVTVVPPKFSMTFQPDQAMVGQEVKITVTSSPELQPKLVNYVWITPSDRISYQNNESVIGFLPKDTRQVEFQVSARAPGTGEIIQDNIKGIIVASQYKVTATVIGVPETQRPKVWKDGRGLVPLEAGAYAVDEQVRLKAGIEGYPNSSEVRWSWSANEGTVLTSPTSSEPAAYRHETGAAQVTVVARDREGRVMGTASASFSVTVSRDALTKAAGSKEKPQADKAERSQPIPQQIAEATDKERKGLLDEAIILADEAANQDPKNAEAAGYSARLKSEKEQVLRQLDKTNKLMTESEYAAAQKELIVAQNLQGKYAPVIDMNARLADEWRKYNDYVRDEFYKVSGANERRDFEAALRIAKQARSAKKLTKEYDDQLRNLENIAQNELGKKAKAQQSLKSAEDSYRKYDYAETLKQLNEGIAGMDGFWAANSAERAEYVRKRDEAAGKIKRLGELQAVPNITASSPPAPSKAALQQALSSSAEAIKLQPNNAELARLKQTISDRMVGEGVPEPATNLPVSDSEWNMTEGGIWTFHADGTFESPTHHWKGSWKTSGGKKIDASLTISGVTDSFSIEFSADGNSFIAYKNGSQYRHGALRQAANVRANSGDKPARTPEIRRETAPIQTGSGTSNMQSAIAPGSESLVGAWLLRGNGQDSGPLKLAGQMKYASPVSDRFGRSGGAMRFNGSEAGIEIAHNPQIELARAATFAAWFKLDRLPSEAGRIMEIIAKPGSGADLDLQIETDNRVKFYVSGGTTLISRAPIAAGHWHHVAATYQANGQIALYLDGQLETRQSFAGVRPAAGNPLGIGVNTYWRGRSFEGAMSDVMVFSRALTAAEIETIYKAKN
jgi:hypothetical protein